MKGALYTTLCREHQDAFKRVPFYAAQEPLELLVNPNSVGTGALQVPGYMTLLFTYPDGQTLGFTAGAAAGGRTVRTATDVSAGVLSDNIFRYCVDRLDLGAW